MGTHELGRPIEVSVLGRLSTNKPEPKLDKRWYGRRHGRKLRPGRQVLVNVLLPKLRIAPPEDGDGPVDLDTLFPITPKAFWMEIGFGTGEHLAAIAANHPDIGFIGCEPFVNGVASLLAKIEERDITNVRIFDDDVRLLIKHLPGSCLDRIFILFADPWPKSRHKRRRMTVPENLAEFTRLLADNGYLVFASDQHDFAAWTLANILREPALEWTARRPSDWKMEPDDWFPTRYQLKAQGKGLAPVFIEVQRRPRDAMLPMG